MVARAVDHEQQSPLDRSGSTVFLSVAGPTQLDRFQLAAPYINLQHIRPHASGPERQSTPNLWSSARAAAGARTFAPLMK
jgi:hypothetical protein